ncbi:conserved hypothetical protein [Neospora caninum Liverpool]|uniref:Uncharacterized protein n=1 Tax=Neospora caninum (strain Liverpool) TaxID=572307 RepID=F0VLE0_NEOCL|nr:conserved hypothetical protein [Neospora caninum Liverpool]CBZ54068.1 conserved hypothetical protein [Neospora caninum Liverpool]|eukprot:XP_003884099.1 conserved hypothetical protein [Neospora caninum Liverpool]
MTAPSPLPLISSQAHIAEEGTGITSQDLHTCVCRKHCQLALCLGRKHRCNPLQNLDCPLAFAVVKVLKDKRTEGAHQVDEVGKVDEDAQDREKEPRTLTDTPQSGVCPVRDAEAVLVIFKGKFASLVLNGIASVEDTLVLEGLRCRPFFRPGRREDLYSWAAECLNQLRTGQPGGDGASDPLLRVCTTHYLTLADVYDDAKITIQPQSAPALPAFSLSAPELVTCSAFPSSLPLPDWLVARNAQTLRSIFASRVLKRSDELKRSLQGCASSSCVDENQEGPASTPGSPSSRRAPRTTSPSRDSKTAGRSSSAVPSERETGAGEGERPREARRTAAQASSARASGREGATESDYVYTDLASLQANRGTNLYGIVWEVGKALMPQPGGKSQTTPSIFLMNVAIFDETVKFDVGRDTAPGGSSEEFSLATDSRISFFARIASRLPTVVRPPSIPNAPAAPCIDGARPGVSDVVMGSLFCLSACPYDSVLSRLKLKTKGCPADIPCMSCGDIVRVHRTNVSLPFLVFTTQYYKPLAALQRCNGGPMMREVYGDLIVRVVKSSMTSCCRLLDLGEPDALISDFSWLRGDSSCSELRQFDSELSAYLLLIEDGSLPGGHVAVVNLSSASAEQLFVSETPIQEGQWLRLRNFKWSSFRLHDVLFGRIYFCVQPSRSDLARITRLPHFARDAVHAQHALDTALQTIVGEEEENRETVSSGESTDIPPGHGGGELGEERPAPESEEVATAQPAAVETVEERVEEPGLAEAQTEESRLPLGALPARFEFYVPKELLDSHQSVSVYKHLDPLLAFSRRTSASAPPRRMRSGPFLLREMHVLGVEPRRGEGVDVDLQNPQAWLEIQCLLCRTSRRLDAPELDGDASSSRPASRKKNRGKKALRAECKNGNDPSALLWCPTCRHGDAAMLVVMYDFRLVLADAHGTHLVVELKDAVGARFSCVSERGISPFFAATDSGAQALVRSVLRGLLDGEEEGERDESPRGGRETEAGQSAGRDGGAGAEEEETEEVNEGASSSSEEEGEVQTQSLVGRKYMRQRSLKTLARSGPAQGKAREESRKVSGFPEKRKKRELGPGRHELLVVRRPRDEGRGRDREEDESASPVWVVLGADIRET